MTFASSSPANSVNHNGLAQIHAASVSGDDSRPTDNGPPASKFGLADYFRWKHAPIGAVALMNGEGKGPNAVPQYRFAIRNRNVVQDMNAPGAVDRLVAITRRLDAEAEASAHVDPDDEITKYAVGDVYDTCSTYDAMKLLDKVTLGSDGKKTGGRRAENAEWVAESWYEYDTQHRRDVYIEQFTDARWADKAAQMSKTCCPSKAAAFAMHKHYLANVLGLTTTEDGKTKFIPLIVDSGGGLHIYHLFTEAIPKELAEPVAWKEKILCKAHGILIDSSRAADFASVLRPPETRNRRYKHKPWVRIMNTDEPTRVDFTYYSQLVDTAYARLTPEQIIAANIAELGSGKARKSRVIVDLIPMSVAFKEQQSPGWLERFPVVGDVRPDLFFTDYDIAVGREAEFEHRFGRYRAMIEMAQSRRAAVRAAYDALPEPNGGSEMKWKKFAYAGPKQFAEEFPEHEEKIYLELADPMSQLLGDGSYNEQRNRKLWGEYVPDGTATMGSFSKPLLDAGCDPALYYQAREDAAVNKQTDAIIDAGMVALAKVVEEPADPAVAEQEPADETAKGRSVGETHVTEPSAVETDAKDSPDRLTALAALPALTPNALARALKTASTEATSIDSVDHDEPGEQSQATGNVLIDRVLEAATCWAILPARDFVRTLNKTLVNAPTKDLIRALLARPLKTLAQDASTHNHLQLRMIFLGRCEAVDSATPRAFYDRMWNDSLPLELKTEAVAGMIFGVAKKAGWDETANLMTRIKRLYAFAKYGKKSVVLRDWQELNGPAEIISMDEFRNDLHYLVTYQYRGNAKTSSEAQYALNMPGMKTFGKIRFLPGRTRMLNDEYNLWKPPTLVPKEGKTPYWDYYVRYILANNHHLSEEYIHDWIAFIIQNADKKVGTYLCFTGRQGVGKTKLAEVIGSMIGERYMLMNARAKKIFGNFNDPIVGKRGCVFDDDNLATSGVGTGEVKMFATSKTLSIEPKGIGAFEEQSFHFGIILANDDVLAVVESDDRRFAIFEVSDVHLRDAKFFASMDHELDNGGREAILQKYLTRDIKGFDPQNIPMTDARSLNIDANMKPLDSVIFDLLNNPNGSFAGQWLEASNLLPADSVDSQIKQMMRSLEQPEPSIKRISSQLKKLANITVLPQGAPGKKRAYNRPSIKDCRNHWDSRNRSKPELWLNLETRNMTEDERKGRAACKLAGHDPDLKVDEKPMWQIAIDALKLLTSVKRSKG